VHAVGARLTSEIAPAIKLTAIFNRVSKTYRSGGQVGWGPMMCETAYFCEDMIGRTQRVYCQRMSPEVNASSRNHDRRLTLTNALFASLNAA